MHNKDIEKNIENIIKHIAPNSKSLCDTPKRVAKAYNEFFSGYNTDIKKIGSTTYKSEMDDMIILKKIPFDSHCEHHIVPIIGIASIGYIPSGKIIGMSKLARIVDCFARRLQLQERMTMEIANAIDEILSPLGVGVYIEAEHFCVSHRGIKKHGAKFVTKYFLGNMKENFNLRAEFLSEATR